MLRIVVIAACAFTILIVNVAVLSADETWPRDDATAPDRAVKFVLDDDERWPHTATNNYRLSQGDPTTLTWGIVPDGTPIVPRRDTESDLPSNLVGFMDATHGDDWLDIFASVFDRYSSLSGLTYVYEPNDDGFAISESEYATGILGVRPDIRIGGHQVDQSSDLAYNYFPDNGDMVLDTSDDFLKNKSRLFNLIAHEHGHGLGLRHVFSSDSRLLMQPFITTDFDGPQFDDVLALHRGYGDSFEKKLGNDSAETAFPLGEYRKGRNLVVGEDAILTDVVLSQTDFVSIDGISDVDFFSFSLPASTMTSIQLDPVGPTYMYGDSRDTQSLFDATMQNDLSLALFRQGTQVPVASSQRPGLGSDETIDRILLGAGDYTIRVSGNTDAVQMYRLTIGEISDALPGDFNGNRKLDVDDVQMLIDQTRSGDFHAKLDLNSDDVLDRRDLAFWVRELKNTFFGDANLDGEFNSSDLVQVFRSAEYEDELVGNSSWSTGDWNGDGDFGSSDLIAAFQDAGFERGARQSVQAVPEPTMNPMQTTVMLSAILWMIRRRRYRQPLAATR